MSLPPDISHRYVAVRSGVGSFGWSGNVGIKGYGAAIILDTTVTSAELEPTDPIAEEDSFCDKCKLCVSSCPSGFFDKKKTEEVTLGGKTFTHAARNSYSLCFLVCGGFTGISRDGKWSTFSPGRMEVPENATEEDLSARLKKAVANYRQWPKRSDGDGGYVNESLKDVTIRLTCGCCQTVCAKDKKARNENYKLLKNSGCVIQRENGDIVVLPPEEAAKEFEKMSPEHKALYM
jgi:epoxyqueuosine reductase